MRAKAFTLVEVLIALTIIGLVAAITVPSIINSTKDAEHIAAWKKSFATLSQAYTKVLSDNGGNFKGACADNDNNCLLNKFTPYLSYIKSCNNSITDGSSNQCIYDTNGIKLLWGGLLNYRWTQAGLVLNNNNIILIGWTDLECDKQWDNSNVKACGAILVDVNGMRSPNTVGKDIYMAWITEKQLLPIGAFDQNNPTTTNYNSSSCDPTNPTARGWGCAAKNLYN